MNCSSRLIINYKTCMSETQDTAALHPRRRTRAKASHAHTPHTRTRIAQSRPCTLWQTHPHGRVHVQAPSCAQKCPRSHLSGESHEVKKCPRSHGGKQTRRVHALHVRLRSSCSDMHPQGLFYSSDPDPLRLSRKKCTHML